MINDFGEQRVSYRTRYLNFPSTMTGSVSRAATRPTLSVFKIRFNNVFTKEKMMFLLIAVGLGIFSLFSAYTLLSIYNSLTSQASNIAVVDQAVVPTEASVDVMNKMAMPSGVSNGNSSGNDYMAYNNGGNGSGSFFIAESDKESSNNSKTAMADNAGSKLSKKVLISVDDSEKQNPFLPPASMLKNPNPYFVEPPDVNDVDSDAVKVTKAKVTGILYDRYSPSAIINIEGSDYLVKKGDKINKYTILGISQSYVSVSLGSNIYQASVGELLTLKSNSDGSIPNLDKRFGGSSGIDSLVYGRKR